MRNKPSRLQNKGVISHERLIAWAVLRTIARTEYDLSFNGQIIQFAHVGRGQQGKNGKEARKEIEGKFGRVNREGKILKGNKRRVQRR